MSPFINMAPGWLSLKGRETEKDSWKLAGNGKTFLFQKYCLNLGKMSFSKLR